MLQIALIEDDARIRETLTTYLSFQNEFDQVKSYDSVEAFLPDATRPDIVLLDINLNGMSGIDGIPKIKQLFPDTEVIMISVNSDNESIFRSLCAGAGGYLAKETPLEKIKEALLDIYRGGSPITPAIARKLVEYFNPQKHFKEELSPREKDIIQCIIDGLSYKLVADKLGISIDTVRKNIKNIYRKLHINSKGELIARFHKGL